MTTHSRKILPPMTALPVFEAVGRHLSVARAADELHLTAGAVSRQVRNLESFLGLSLFERGHRRIVFTPAGETYWARIHAALGDLREVTNEISASADGRPLVIAAPRMFLQKCVMPALGTLHASHPDLVVKFVTGPQENDALDGAIAVSPAPRKGFVIESLAPADLIPVCSPAYLRAAPPLETPDDLERHTLLRSAEYTRNWERWLGPRTERVFARARFIDFETSGLEPIGALEGLGIAIMRLRLVQDEIASGRLVALFPESVVHDEYVLQFQDTKLRSSAFRTFRLWLRRAAAT